MQKLMRGKFVLSELPLWLKMHRFSVKIFISVTNFIHCQNVQYLLHKTFKSNKQPSAQIVNASMHQVHLLELQILMNNAK